MSERFEVFLQYLLPKQALTEFGSHIASMRGGAVTTRIIRWFVGKYGVNIASVKQRRPDGSSAPVSFVTYKAREKSMMKAIDEIGRLPEVAKVESLIRIEN